MIVLKIIIIILVCAAALLLAAAALILLPTIRLRFSGRFDHTQPAAQLQLSWLHRHVLRFTLELLEQQLTVHILHFKKAISPSSTDTLTPEPSTPPTQSEPAPSINPTAPAPPLAQSPSDTAQQPLTLSTAEQEYEILNSGEQPKHLASPKHTAPATAPDNASTANSAHSSEKAQPPPASELPPAAPEKKRGLLLRLRRNRALYLVRQHRLRRKLLRWGGRVMRSFLHLVVIEKLQLRVRADLGDAAVNGMVAGSVDAIGRMMHSGSKVNVAIRFEPCFCGEALECEGEVALRSSVLRLIMPLLVALFTLPVVYGAFIWYRSGRYVKRIDRQEFERHALNR